MHFVSQSGRYFSPGDLFLDLNDICFGNVNDQKKRKAARPYLTELSILIARFYFFPSSEFEKWKVQGPLGGKDIQTPIEQSPNMFEHFSNIVKIKPGFLRIFLF